MKSNNADDLKFLITLCLKQELIFFIQMAVINYNGAI